MNHSKPTRIIEIGIPLLEKILFTIDMWMKTAMFRRKQKVLLDDLVCNSTTISFLSPPMNIKFQTTKSSLLGRVSLGIPMIISFDNPKPYELWQVVINTNIILNKININIILSCPIFWPQNQNFCKIFVVWENLFIAVVD